jgi:hypothetical protein
LSSSVVSSQLAGVGISVHSTADRAEWDTLLAGGKPALAAGRGGGIIERRTQRQSQGRRSSRRDGRERKEYPMAADVKSIPIGLQLYSVRHECEKDDGKNFPNIVKAVAKMGYEAVEFAGYFGWEAEDIRRVLDDNALPCCGTHVGIQTLVGDELKRSIDFHRTIGNQFLIVPGLPEEYRNSIGA